MAKIAPQIEKLLRTNTALAFLCIISIGILILLLRHSDPTKQTSTPTHDPVVVSTGESTHPSPVVTDEELVPSLAASPFREGPVPGKLPTFVFAGQTTVKTTFTCTDVYDVALIYPTSIDYRLYPLSSLYNRATACTKGTTASRTISIENMRTEVGMTYYIVRAHQGKKGSWYDPY